MADVIVTSQSHESGPQWSALSIYGLAAFCLSATAHFLTFAGIALQQRFPLIWVLHIGIFPLFIPFVRSLQKRREQGDSRHSIWAMLEGAPTWTRILCTPLFLYAGFNFFNALQHLPGKGGEHLVEPAVEAVYTMRLFSGHWLVFYAFPTLYYLFVPRESRIGTLMT